MRERTEKINRDKKINVKENHEVKANQQIAKIKRKILKINAKEEDEEGK